jgi:hypothetical protein
MSGRRRVRRSRGRTVAAAAVAIGASLLATVPAEAHSTTYCGHSQVWDKSNQFVWLGSVYMSYRDTVYGHIHKYRHWNYYTYTGQLSIMHSDVEKLC